jgi:hypothetical protein
MRTNAPDASDRRVRRGARTGLPDWMKKPYFFHLLEKHFHTGPSTQCPPISLLNETA